MANICDNKFYFSCNEENYEKYLEKFDKLFDSHLIGEVTYCNPSGCIEGYFESKWSFPQEVFEELFKDATEDVYFRCLSEEYGCGYVAMNILKNTSWNEQTFEL